MKSFFPIGFLHGNGLLDVLVEIRAGGIEILDAVGIVSAIAEKRFNVVYLGKIAGFAFAHDEFSATKMFGLDGL